MAGVVTARSAETAPLVLEATIPLPNVSGRIDHMAIDLARKRLLVVELGNDTVDVVDVSTRRVIHRISGQSEPQGVAYVPASDMIVIANGGDGSVRIFAAADFAPRGAVTLGDDADNAHVDPHSSGVVVGYGNGGLAVIDPVARARTRTIALPVHPEGFQISPLANRVFVNLPEAHQIAVTDLATGKALAIWGPLAWRANFPMAIDQAGALVAVAFRAPSRLAIFDTKTGAIAASAETCGDADDVFFDFKRGRLYVSCGEGAIDVFNYASGSIRLLARVASASGARTSLYVPELDRLFVARGGGWLGTSGAIFVYRPSP